MTGTIQRAELHAQIWKIANDVRGSVDGWDFKHFVLGTLFYRFISETFTNYIEGGDERVDYVAKSVDFEKIAENDYNLSVSSYLEAKDTREVVDITTLNAELKITVEKIDQLRSDINAIVTEINEK